MTKILVTGSNGFLGQHVMRALLSQYPRKNILGIGRKLKKKPWPVVACDISDKEATQKLIKKFKPTLIYHLVGVPAHSHWQDLWRTYILTTESLMEAVEHAELKKCRVIIPGSVVEYGVPQIKNRPLNETSATNPVTLYGKIKLFQTQFALAMESKSMDVIVGRIFNLIGPECSKHLAVGSWARQIGSIEKGKQPPFIKVGNIKNARDFIDIRDAAFGIISLGKKGYSGNIYNICSNKGIPLRKILDTLIQVSHVKRKISVKMVYSRLRNKNQDPKKIVGSYAKIKRHTGWKPTISIKKSITDTLASLR